MRSLVISRVEHEKMKLTSMHGHVISSIYLFIYLFYLFIYFIYLNMT